MSDSHVDAPPGLAGFAAFWVGDVILLLAASLVFQQAHRPMVLYEVIAVGCGTALAALLGVWPFVLRQRALEARAERAQLAGTLAQLQRLEEVAERIGLATGQWQTVQEHANTAVAGAREIAERLTEEQRAFRDMLQQGQAARVQHLELEVTKLRRAENDWLQVTVRILDHVYALYLAAARSGQPHLAEQIGAFQNACRDAARRIGLVAHAVAPGTAYDPQAHQLADPNTALPEEPTVAGTIGPGYLFQGQLLRRAVVVVQPRAALDRALPPVSGESVAFSSDSRAEPAGGQAPTGSWTEASPDPAADGAAATVSGDHEPLTTSFTTGRPDDLPAGGA